MAWQECSPSLDKTSKMMIKKQPMQAPTVFLFCEKLKTFFTEFGLYNKCCGVAKMSAATFIFLHNKKTWKFLLQ